MTYLFLSHRFCFLRSQTVFAYYPHYGQACSRRVVPFPVRLSPARHVCMYHRHFFRDEIHQPKCEHDNGKGDCCRNSENFFLHTENDLINGETEIQQTG